MKGLTYKPCCLFVIYVIGTKIRIISIALNPTVICTWHWYVFFCLGEWRVSDVLVTELKQNNDGTVTIPSSGFPHLNPYWLTLLWISITFFIPWMTGFIYLTSKWVYLLGDWHGIGKQVQHSWMGEYIDNIHMAM